jgi:hypothetical protein
MIFIKVKLLINNGISVKEGGFGVIFPENTLLIFLKL